MLRKTEWDEWANHPVSQALNDFLAKECAVVIENLATGSDNHALETIGAKTVACRAQLKILQRIMEIDLQVLNDRNQE